jgi:phenylpropionate dioxygenase-like ring-hydroxylating dioxygenase large terminal subunit
MTLNNMTTNDTFVIINCTEKNEIAIDITKNENMIKHLYSYFKSLDISHFEPEKLVTNIFRKESTTDNSPVHMKMLKDHPERFNGKSYTSKQIYTMSIEYANKNELLQIHTHQKCAKDLKKYFGQYFKHVTVGNFYVFPLDFSDTINVLP